jgi:putative transcriptional regulator
MPIVVKLDDMLHARRMTLTELAERVGITLANVSILKTGKARAVRFSTLEAICDVLQCQPGDLLEYARPPVKEAAAAADHATAPSAARGPLKRRLDAVPEEASTP